MLLDTWKTCTSKIEIDIADDVMYTGLGTDDILTVSTDYKLADNLDNPMGCACSATGNIKLLDKTKKFSKTNIDSPYYGLFKEGATVRLFNKVDSGEYAKIATMYVSEFKSDVSVTTQSTVTMSLVDRLKYLYDKPVTIKSTKKSITAYNFFVYAFEQLGLTSDDYVIDELLMEKTVKYGFGVGSKSKELFENMCMSFMCNMYVDADNIIRVVCLESLASNEVVMNLNAKTGAVYKTSSGSDMLKNYSGISINYNKMEVDKNHVLLSKDDYEVATGNSTSDYIEVEDSVRVVEYKYVSAQSGSGLVKVSGLSGNQGGFNVSLNNTGETQENIKLVVVGYVVKESSAKYNKKIDSVDSDKARYLSVTCKFIQSKGKAIEVADKLLNYLHSGVGYVTASMRGNPLLKVGDVVTLYSEANKIDGTFIVSSLKLNFSGGLASTVELIDVNSVTVAEEEVTE